MKYKAKLSAYNRTSMIRLGILLVIAYAIIWAQTGYTREITIRLDRALTDSMCYIDELDATTNFFGGVEHKWGDSTNSDAAKYILLSLNRVDDSLQGDSIIDSAMILFMVTSDQQSSSDTLHPVVNKVLRTVLFQEATWNIFSTGNNWQTAGAAGALDINTSSSLVDTLKINNGSKVTRALGSEIAALDTVGFWWNPALVDTLLQANLVIRVAWSAADQTENKLRFRTTLTTDSRAPRIRIWTSPAPVAGGGDRVAIRTTP